MNARLVGRAKGVVLPDIAVAVRVSIDKVNAPIALRCIVGNIVVRCIGSQKTHDDAYSKVVVRGIGPHIVSGGTVSQCDAESSVGYVVVTQAVIGGGLQPEPDKTPRNAISVEIVLRGRTSCPASDRKAAEDENAVQRVNDGYANHRRMRHLLKVDAHAKVGDRPRPSMCTNAFPEGTPTPTAIPMLPLLPPSIVWPLSSSST